MCLKKQKTSTALPKPRWILIPIITGKEDHKNFMMSCAADTNRVVLVSIIEDSMPGSELEEYIKQKEDILDYMEDFFRKLGVAVKTYLEWGSWDKVKVIAEKEQVDEILVYDTTAKNKLNVKCKIVL
jgi:hypothetical protein